MTEFKQIQELAQTHKSELFQHFYVKEKISHPVLKKLRPHQLKALMLLSAESQTDCFRLIRQSRILLEEHINEPEYQFFTIRKKKGGKRIIHAPGENLKKAQRKLNSLLQAYYLWIKPKEVFGFTANPYKNSKNFCNIRENAKIHTGKRHLLNIDLKDFFPSIKAWQVKELFTSAVFDFNEEVATVLALLTTYQGKLPTGAPTSPVISNFICLQLDQDLKRFAQHHKLKYSRYADDLSFSADHYISFDEVLDIINIIRKNGFKINEKKLRMTASHRKQVVTGVVVNKKVNVDRNLMKKIRAMLHDLSANSLFSATKNHFKIKGPVTDKNQIDFLNKLEGYINFVGQIRGKNDLKFRRFRAELDRFYFYNKRTHAGILSNR